MKAFPEVSYLRPEGVGASVMQITGGMDLRDYFAAQAMMGQMVNSPVFGGVSHSQSAYAVSVATNAYAVADAMMKAREK